MHDLNSYLLAGCSFTDPTWQTVRPWSVEFSKKHPAYIVAKAGMGIKGIATETLYYLSQLPNVSTLIIVLPTLWRLDIEVDQKTYLCNSMVDLLYSDSDWNIVNSAKRKWITSGGLRYERNTEQAQLFDLLYKHQGFLVIAKEHFTALKALLNYCKQCKIQYYISAIQDPMDQVTGIEYIKDDIVTLLDDVEYKNWFRFDNKFIDKFLGHTDHPSTAEHVTLCKHIINITKSFI
jgi:hypothetical protein